MCHFYNKIRKNLLIICPILNLQGFKDIIILLYILLNNVTY